MEGASSQCIVIIEPFYGGSHKKLIDVLTSGLPKCAYTLITMSAKKWHWRARTSALYVSTLIPKDHNMKVLFCTSVLPLTELLGLRPDLSDLYKIVYFHENQLTFPVRVTKERDFQYGFNEILSCLAANKVLFNSQYNKDSFIDHVDNHLKLQPDHRIKGLSDTIRSKSEVIYFPIDLQTIDQHLSPDCLKDDVLHIIWPHRWEFDKNPEEFYKVICRLIDNNQKFKVSILGETFNKKPEVYNDISGKLGSRLVHCGYVENICDYYRVLQSGDVVVSTAIHEYFGVAIMEAVYCGCIPVVPKRLAYNEFYLQNVKEMYETEEELLDTLMRLCKKKQEGKLNYNYKQLALPYESKKWLARLLDIFPKDLMLSEM